MKYILSNVYVFVHDKFIKSNVFIDNNIISDISTKEFFPSSDNIIFNLDNCFLFPGFLDVHVHLREPGFFCKETIKSGTMAAARGGYTTVCSMPNLSPTPDSRENLDIQLELIRKNACIEVIPYGTITIGENGEELTNYEGLANDVCGFSDDGRGVQNNKIMKEAMTKISQLGKVLAAHCEDESLIRGGYINAGDYAAENNHKGICSESEWKQIERDLELVRETGCKYHICHISTKESVDLIRQAKLEGLDVSCETAPHYLVMNDDMLKDEGRFKMNPPIRSELDRLALIIGIKDGTIDMIATDHAPHTAEEKSKGLRDSAMGIVGLETAFPILYTELVKKELISLEKLISLLHENPRKRFKISSPLEVGQVANFTVFDLEKNYKINPEDFLSMGKATPFENKEVYGECILTMASGKIAYQGKNLKPEKEV